MQGKSYAALFSAILLVVVACSTPVIRTPAFAATSTTNTGIMVPLYTYPGSTWDSIIQAKNANPSVPFVAVINPDNGPGSAQDSNYVAGIQKLQAAKILVLGYVYTSYAARSQSSVQSDIDAYKSWYKVNGTFFDEMSNTAGYETYYSSLSSYAKAQGQTYTVGNPGADTLSSYVGTVDNIIIYENSGLPSISFLSSGWHTNYDKKNFSFLSYGVSSVDNSFVTNAASYTGFMYLTDDTLPNPWDSVPSFLGTLAADLSAVDTSTTSSSPTHYTVTVQSAKLSGSQLSGITATVQQNGLNTLTTENTPFSFQAYSGSSYTITVATSSKSHVFDHWENGSTNPSRTISATGDTTLVAYYKH